MKTFERHPSILEIKELNSDFRFPSENVGLEDVKRLTRELDISKASRLLDIQLR